MSDSQQLGLPFLAPAQAQKHVTVNEALARLDGLVPMVLQSRSQTLPPLAANEGQVWALPGAGLVNAWEGQEGKLAIFTNGGWLFASPRRGWRGFLLDEGVMALCDGLAWVAGAQSLSPQGAGLCITVTEASHSPAAGTSSTTALIIPAGMLVIGVTARVSAAIGTAGSWSLGHAGAPDRFGSGLGMGAGAWGLGLLGSPMAYYSPEALVLSATGGSFSGAGMVRLALHGVTLTLPGA